MRILITVVAQCRQSGTELYTRDLALALKRRGHEPAVFAGEVGPLAQDLREAGIPISDRFEELPGRFDLIHGQHFSPTLQALARFPGIPAVHVCHDHSWGPDKTPLHPRIVRHFGVSRICQERLVREGIEPGRADLLLNWVDLRRFPARPPLPERPRRALVFSNYATEENHLAVVRAACRLADLELDVVGAGVGRPVREPGAILTGYDLVFAKAKAALEAMATGTAVVLCDFAGVGPMVGTRNVQELRPLNFGFAALTAPFEVPVLLERIGQYNALDALKLRDLVRAECGLEVAVDRLLGIYQEVVEEHGPRVRCGTPLCSRRVRRELARLYRRRWFAPFRRSCWVRRLLVNRLGI